AGFYGEATNLAHNLPLGANPHTDATAARHFNASARRLHVPPDQLTAAAAALQHHDASGRPRERDHPLAMRKVTATPGAPSFRPVPDERRDRGRWTRSSPMTAVDEGFLAAV